MNFADMSNVHLSIFQDFFRLPRRSPLDEAGSRISRRLAPTSRSGGLSFPRKRESSCKPPEITGQTSLPEIFSLWHENPMKSHFFKEKRIMKTIRTIAAGAILAVILSASVVIAAEGMGSASSPQVAGEWNFTSKFEAMTSDATMTINKYGGSKGKGAGVWSGTWSAQWGESTLSDINVDDRKVTFTQTSNFGGQEMKTSYEGTLEGEKLKGTAKGQWGEFTFEGTREKTTNQQDQITGNWQMNIMIPAREIVEKMTITQNTDGTLAGKWEGMRGGENTISNLKFAEGKLTFTRTSKMGGNDFTMTFEGTVTGDTIKGAFASDFGERAVTASRAAAKPQTPKAEPNKPPAGKK
jgi:hypothetical protein